MEAAAASHVDDGLADGTSMADGKVEVEGGEQFALPHVCVAFIIKLELSQTIVVIVVGSIYLGRVDRYWRGGAMCALFFRTRRLPFSA